MATPRRYQRLPYYLSIRAVDDDTPGWHQLVEHIPVVGTMLSFGCAPEEVLDAAEATRLVREGPWRVMQVHWHLLCPVEAEDVPGDAITIEVLVEPWDAATWEVPESPHAQGSFRLT
jgi:hypothetical protein